jgi:hydroxymethylbilane synthase
MSDRDTEIQTRAERAFLGALEGGCQVPIGALATMAASPRLHGFISDVHGRQQVRGSVELDLVHPEQCGLALAKELRGRGATEILVGLRKVEKAPSPQPE